ncbi:MAG: hypothetical protein ACI96P_000400 [Candidatus Azotimanducaceae bacterium]
MSIIILFWLICVSDVVEKVQKSAIRALYQLVKEVTEGDSSGLIFGQIGTILLEEFITNMNVEFDDLMGRSPPRDIVVDFETLSLVQDEELTAMVAMEGMIATARNQHLPSFISFNTRLNNILADQKIRVDEATNPLDPQQIAGAFTAATKGLGRSPQENLLLYRRFNEVVLKRLDHVLHDANKILIEHGVIPKLGMETGTNQTNNTSAVRTKPRQAPDAVQGFGMVEEDPYDADSENPELFSMMQNLLRRDVPAQPPAAQPTTGPAGSKQQYAIPASLMAAGVTNDLLKPAAGEAVEMVDQQTLMAILTNIQQSLQERDSKDIPKTIDDVEKLDVNGSLTEMLQHGDSGGTQAIDEQSADVINLVSLLFDAIWKDDSLAIPIKELIGRTQVTIIKVALSDTTFFNRENHPARRILNEFAEAGLGWTEVEHLDEDPLYQKISQLVTKLMRDYKGEISFFDDLVKDFKQFRAKEAAKTQRLEQRIMRAKERKERLEDIHELVTRKIAERVLGRDLQSFVQELLDTIYHKFMVMLVIKEGPGSNAWTQCINTIDVLLWSVQPKDQRGDRVRLETVNPRLLNNLRKAFRIAQVESSQVDDLISRLKQIQEASLLGSELARPAGEESTGYRRDLFEREVGETVAPVDSGAPAAGNEDLDDEDADMQRVDKLSVGVWVEFLGEGDQTIRCKLAAKINAIDKYIFVNRQGVKVIEKTRMGLARELKDGTVKMISEGLLFSRALESVIGNLRISQQEQQTGGAYQPAEPR